MGTWNQQYDHFYDGTLNKCIFCLFLLINLFVQLIMINLDTNLNLNDKV